MEFTFEVFAVVMRKVENIVKYIREIEKVNT